jgi:disulfide bond formation protein DsbB
MSKKIFTHPQIFIYITWVQAIAATLGSLYFSEIAKYQPCVLCWYQRILMYPLVLIIASGIIQRDRKIPLYVLPLSVMGLGISVYHNLLYWKILPHAAAPCTAGVSCTSKFIEWFGFVTIPFLAMVAFSVITASMITYMKLSKRHDQ